MVISITNGLIYNLQASTIAASSGADISSVSNPAGAATATATGPFPVLQIENGVKRVRNAPASGLSLAFSSLDGGEITIFMVARRFNLINASAEGVMVQLGDYYGAPNLVGLADFYGEVQAMGTASTKYPSGFASSENDTLYCLCASSSGNGPNFGITGAGVKFFKNGIKSFRAQSPNGQPWSPGIATYGFLGGIGSGQGIYHFDGEWRYFLVYNRALSDAEIAIVSAEIAGDCNIALHTHELNLVFDGDSQTTGQAEGEPSPLYVDSVLLSQRKPFSAFNIAIYGQGILQAGADGAAQSDALYRNGMPNVLALWLGTNDLWAFPNDAATHFARLKARGQQARAAGFKVIVIPCMPRAVDATAYEAGRQSYNASIAADPSFYDVALNPAATPELFAPLAQNNTRYFSADKIHLSGVGYRLIASKVAAALANLLNSQILSGADLNAVAAATRALLAASPVPALGAATVGDIPTPPTAAAIATAVVAKTEIQNTKTSADLARRILRSGQQLNTAGTFAELREGAVLWARYPVSVVNGAKVFGELEIL